MDDITLGGLSFSLSPNTPNQKIILEHLDGQLDSASGEFVTDLTILAGLTDGEFQDALDALSPEPYIGLRDAGLRVVRSGSATVTERLQSLYLAQMAGVDLDQLYAPVIPSCLMPRLQSFRVQRTALAFGSSHTCLLLIKWG